MAANLLLLSGATATYLHGGTADIHRELMAPHLVQWEQIRFAKAQGITRYDFGGMKTADAGSSWSGITRFKQGFAPETAPTLYPGSYDIVVNAFSYTLYNGLRGLKNIIGR